jgi:hypothetical protein
MLPGRYLAGLTAPLLLAGTLAGFGPALPSAAASAACQGWTGAPPLSPGSTSNRLNGVTVLSACDAWAVGFQSDGTTGKTLIEHWDGASWTVVPSPSPGGVDDELRGVDAVSASSVWAVGSTSDGSGERSLIEHWNGTRWNVVKSPSPGTAKNELWSVHAASAADVWAVGFASSGGKDQTLILRWTGHAWAQVSSPNPTGASRNNDLFGVTATSHTDVWAVGDGLDPVTLAATSVILHWNGTRWSRVASPSPGQTTGLGSVAATSAGNAWAVGSTGKGETSAQDLILHWNGHSWATVASPRPGGTQSFNFLSGVTATSAGSALAVGTSITKADSGTQVLSWNGSRWTHLASADPESSDQLFGVDASSAGNAWLVGDSANAASPFHTVALHCC